MSCCVRPGDVASTTAQMMRLLSKYFLASPSLSSLSRLLCVPMTLSLSYFFCLCLAVRRLALDFFYKMCQSIFDNVYTTEWEKR